MAAYVKDAGVWKPTSGKPWVRDAGVWKQPVQGYVRDGGIWKPLFSSTLYEELGAASLTANLKMCVDAGALASYDGTGQYWNDLSGGGVNFTRGSGSGSDGADPTFAGVAGGLSSGEYFSFDGGDYLRLDGANPAWVDELHKNNALFTSIAWVKPATVATTQCVQGTNNLTNAQRGIAWGINSSGAVFVYICRASGSVGLSATGGSVSAGAWQMVSISHDEGGGAAQSWFGVNSTFSTYNGAVTSPSSSTASNQLEIGAPGNGGSAFGGRWQSGGFIAGVATWQGVRLSQANITAIFDATRARYGV